MKIRDLRLCFFFTRLGFRSVPLPSMLLNLPSQKQYPDLQTEYIPLELEDVDSIRRAAQALQQRPVKYLIHNAGIYSTPRCTTVWGTDNLYHINFAAPYYLTTLLLPTLRQHNVRVVLVSSIAHKIANKDSCLQAGVYGYAKRHMLLASQHLFAGEGGCCLTLVHPGITPTGITSHYPKVVRALIKYPMKWIFHSPQKAALNVIAGLFVLPQDGDWIGPSRLGVWGFPKCTRGAVLSTEERQKAANIAQQLAQTLHNQK